MSGGVYMQIGMTFFHSNSPCLSLALASDIFPNPGSSVRRDGDFHRTQSASFGNIGKHDMAALNVGGGVVVGCPPLRSGRSFLCKSRHRSLCVTSPQYRQQKNTFKRDCVLLLTARAIFLTVKRARCYGCVARDLRGVVQLNTSRELASNFTIACAAPRGLWNATHAADL